MKKCAVIILLMAGCSKSSEPYLKIGDCYVDNNPSGVKRAYRVVDTSPIDLLVIDLSNKNKELMPIKYATSEYATKVTCKFVEEVLK